MKISFILNTPVKMGFSFRQSLKKIPFRYTLNIVNKIPCAFGHSYIEQTCRHVPDRVMQGV